MCGQSMHYLRQRVAEKKTHPYNKTDTDDAAEKEALAGKAEADDFVLATDTD